MESIRRRILAAAGTIARRGEWGKVKRSKTARTGGVAYILPATGMTSFACVFLRVRKGGNQGDGVAQLAGGAIKQQPAAQQKSGFQRKLAGGAIKQEPAAQQKVETDEHFNGRQRSRQFHDR